jgi:tRNA pseudouridine55 synthase
VEGNLFTKRHTGEEAETPEREVMVYDLTMVEFDEEAQTARLLALTGSGTYVRTLAEGIGRAAGTGGYAASLRRTRIGHFSVDDALALDELSPERYEEGGRGVLSLEEALGFLPRYVVGAVDARLAANGGKLHDLPAGRFGVYGPEGLVGIYERIGDAGRPLVVFPRTL